MLRQALRGATADLPAVIRHSEGTTTPRETIILTAVSMSMSSSMTSSPGQHHQEAGRDIRAVGHEHRDHFAADVALELRNDRGLERRGGKRPLRGYSTSSTLLNVWSRSANSTSENLRALP